jgi:hypothetical protein
MGNTIIPGLLNDTLSLVQLARETAMAQGKNAQAQKLTPVVDDLKSLVKTSQENLAPVQPGGMMVQSDFKTLLQAANNHNGAQRVMPSQNIVERNQMVVAMAAGNMQDIDIARQMGMTREEVRLILSVQGK